VIYLYKNIPTKYINHSQAAIKKHQQQGKAYGKSSYVKLKKNTEKGNKLR